MAEEYDTLLWLLGRSSTTKATKREGTPIRHLWEAWKRVARRIGDFQARVLLTVLYFIVIAPLALAVRWAADPLALKPATPRGWSRKSTVVGDPLSRARRQF